MKHFSEYTVDVVVPHDSPMSLLDHIEDGGEEWLVASATVPADSLFLLSPEQGAIPAWVGIEYMAQAVAAWDGANALATGRAVKIGLLLGSRRYECSLPAIPVGSRLTIRVRQQLMGQSGLGAFECEMQIETPSGEQHRAEAVLNVFQPDNVDEFLEAN